MPDYQHKFHFAVCIVNLSLAGGRGHNVKKHSKIPDHKKLANALQGSDLTLVTYCYYSTVHLILFNKVF